MTCKHITSEEIIEINNTIRTKCGLSSGHIKKGELDTLATTYSKTPFSLKERSVFEQSAILLEGIIRLHMFTDGNKRTALETTRQFLNRNDYVLVVPLSGASFIYAIAQDCTQETERVLSKIMCWLYDHTARIDQRYKIHKMIVVQTYIPVFIVRFFSKIKLQRCSRWFMKRYLLSKDPQTTSFVIEIYEKQFDIFERAT